MDRKGYKYYQQNASQRIPYLRPPAWLFGIVWFFLDILRLVFIFIFVEWNINVDNWSFLLVTILFIIQELLNLSWTFSFFVMRRSFMALVICFLMLVIAVTITIVTPVANNIGADVITPDGFRFMLMAFYIPYVLWLCFATFLNWQWWSHGKDDMNVYLQEPLLTSVADGFANRHGFKKEK